MVSFDLFETLVLRPFESPRDAFEVLAPLALTLSGGALTDFPRVRVAAKAWARERVGEEVPLDARYRAIAERFGLDPGATAALMAAELDLERRTARPNPVVQRWFADALARGKRVCIVSDTYYPRSFIEPLLEQNGYRGWHRLYVSSETGALKSSGSAFRRLLAELDVAGPRVLHLGDDEVADLRSPERLGIRTWRRPPPRELFARHARASLALQNETLEQRLVRGLVARRFALSWEPEQAPSFAGPSARHLGYSLLGPLLLGFTTWLCRRLAQHQCDAVFFLARDGRVMKEAYDLLRPLREGLPPSRYLWASRRGLLLPAARTTDDLLRLLTLPGSAAPLVELLARRLGVERAELRQLRPGAYGFQSWEELVHAARSRERLQPLVEALSPLVLDKAAAERAALLAYYDENGLRSAERPALVDLGHQGTLQLALGKLTGRDDFLGLYFATVAAIAQVPLERAQSYVGARSTSPQSLTAYEPRLQMFELLFPSDEGSFVRLTQPGAVFRAESWVPPGDEPRQRLCRDLHAGALEFLRELVELLAERTLDVAVPPEEALAPYLAFLARPSAADAECFSGVRVENAFSGRPSTEVVGGRSGIWPEGELCVGRRDGLSTVRWQLELRIREMAFANRRLRKLVRDPRAFFKESRFGALRWLGSRW